jgi:MFS transporter, OFA family, oxalate/formate antiporter
MSDHAASNTKSNFGSKGWLMIFFAGVMFFFYSGMCSDGLNVIVGNFAHAHNLEVPKLLALTTPASWAGLVGAILWSMFVDRKGTRTGLIVTGILGGIAFMLYGVVTTAVGFFVVTALTNFMGFGFCHTVANSLMAKWFPIKKGLALGWATMGQNLATACFIPLFMLFMGLAGLSGSFYIMGGILIIFSILGWFLVRDTPEETGCSPDNGSFTKEELEANLREIREYKSPWTQKKLLANKQIWLIGLGFGIYILVTVALISQMIPRLISGGWSPVKSVSMMTVSAIFGLIGSYATGWLDQKIGTKKASILYGVWYLIALVICALPANDLTMYASVFFIGVGIGGIGNLFPSMASTVFGRFDFVRAMGILNPITAIVRSFAFAILAFGLSKLGGYAGAYAIIAGLDVVGILLVSRIDSTLIGK